ncbi:MAG: hypothetical protein DDT31_00222 [Syntrophomonadaceae bacterium]|nr:hypothetical protein [Bacillota bacterium]
MKTQSFINRIAMSRKLASSRESVSNPAIVAKYDSYDNVTGQIRVISANGGVYYQQKITNQKLTPNQVIPASVQNGQLGFADGRNL